MLKNFEYKTHNLSDEEIKITIGLNIGLKRFVGKKNAIPGSKICESYNTKTEHKMTGVRLRKMINYLRNKGKPICSSSVGYYYPADKKELQDTITSMAQRIDSQLQVINQLKKHL